MRITDLLAKKKLTVQLVWGEQKIEFVSIVLENNGVDVYIGPYIHNGSALELNVTPGKNVICNIFTENVSTRQRVSWKNVELTTVKRNNEIMYSIKTSGYNTLAESDDRRTHDRIVVMVKAQLFEGNSNNPIDVIVHDISDIGISFYAPEAFTLQSRDITVAFSDNIDDRVFDVKVQCSATRVAKKAGNNFVGCRIVKENRDYQLYGFMKRIREKNKSMG